MPAIEAYSAGVISDADHEIVHASLERPVALAEGFDIIGRMVNFGFGRPLAALCAIELRSPRPMTLSEFGSLNRRYSAVVAGLGLLLADGNPIARTNVVPLKSPPDEPSLSGFSLTLPRRLSVQTDTFVIAGAAELNGPSEGNIVRRGDRSPGAVEEKVHFVLNRQAGRLAALEGARSSITAVNVYTALDISSTLASILAQMAPHLARFHWHAALPPIQELDFEMDLRSVNREIVI